jgi:hypothetical protein
MAGKALVLVELLKVRDSGKTLKFGCLRFQAIEKNGEILP